MSDKIVGLPNSFDQTRASLEELKRNVELIMEYQIVTARLKKNLYDAYIAQGFSEVQALHLISVN